MGGGGLLRSSLPLSPPALRPSPPLSSPSSPQCSGHPSHPDEERNAHPSGICFTAISSFSRRTMAVLLCPFCLLLNQTSSLWLSSTAGCSPRHSWLLCVWLCGHTWRSWTLRKMLPAATSPAPQQQITIRMNIPVWISVVSSLSSLVVTGGGGGAGPARLRNNNKSVSARGK